MDKEGFDTAMRLKHGKTVLVGDAINVIDEHSLYQKLYVRAVDSKGYSVIPVSVFINEESFIRRITFDDLLTQFYCFGL